MRNLERKRFVMKLVYSRIISVDVERRRCSLIFFVRDEVFNKVTKITIYSTKY